MNRLKGLPTKPMETPAPISPQNSVVTPPSTPPVNSVPVSQTYTKYPKIYAWAKAIAPEEGARPDLNNPGDLKLTATTATWGATEGFQAEDGGWIAKFNTFEQGFQAQVNLLTLIAANEALGYHLDRTFEGVMKVYADNPLQTYIQGIASAIPCELSTDVSTFLTS